MYKINNVYSIVSRILTIRVRKRRDSKELLMTSLSEIRNNQMSVVRLRNLGVLLPPLAAEPSQIMTLPLSVDAYKCCESCEYVSL